MLYTFYMTNLKISTSAITQIFKSNTRVPNNEVPFFFSWPFSRLELTQTAGQTYICYIVLDNLTPFMNRWKFYFLISFIRWFNVLGGIFFITESVYWYNKWTFQMTMIWFSVVEGFKLFVYENHFKSLKRLKTYGLLSTGICSIFIVLLTCN